MGSPPPILYTVYLQKAALDLIVNLVVLCWVVWSTLHWLPSWVQHYYEELLIHTEASLVCTQCNVCAMLSPSPFLASLNSVQWHENNLHFIKTLKNSKRAKCALLHALMMLNKCTFMFICWTHFIEKAYHSSKLNKALFKYF